MVAIAYRPEIDGLRAVAVLSVVLYHFGFPGLGGGFVGVDVFFVISGYLIGGILWAELTQSGRVSLLRFYIRRFRRLAPAFFAMVAVVSLVGWFVLLPMEYREFAKSLIAATVYLANVQFWRDAGYFDFGAEEKVLLHTWSLSVEEQFYVVLPIAILLLRHHPRVLHLVLWLGFAGSLAASLLLTPRMPEAAFYLFHFRAWELLAGVLLAIGHLQGRRLPDAVQAGLSVLGLGMVLASVVLVQAGPGFPGWQAVFPVLGTVLILAGTGQGNAVNRLLAMRGPVFVGLISYSLYLWHWPIFSLSTSWRGSYDGQLETTFWIALSFGLAVLSWRFVERPFRQGPAWGSAAGAPGARAAGAVAWRSVFGGMGLASAITLGFAAFVFLRDGVAERFPAETRAHIAATQDFLQDMSRCSVASEGPLTGIRLCRIGPEGDAPPEVLVWGDSHLRAMMDGVGQAAMEAGVPGIIIWTAGCPPLFGVTKEESASTAAQDRACPEINGKIEAALPELSSVKRVLVMARWSYYAEGQGFGLDVHNTIRLDPAPGSGLEAAPDLMAAALERTVEKLAVLGPVTVLRQIPEMPGYTSLRAARAMAHGREDEVPSMLTVARAEAEARSARADGMLNALAAEGRIALIDGWDRLCDAETCSVMQEGGPIYFDTNHLTNRGARLLRDLLMPALTGEGA
jgi:peptidoglycan/LPS O-acetylase OafA/YrhL